MNLTFWISNSFLYGLNDLGNSYHYVVWMELYSPHSLRRYLVVAFWLRYLYGRLFMRLLVVAVAYRVERTRFDCFVGWLDFLLLEVFLCTIYLRVFVALFQAVIFSNLQLFLLLLELVIWLRGGHLNFDFFLSRLIKQKQVSFRQSVHLECSLYLQLGRISVYVYYFLLLFILPEVAIQFSQFLNTL